MPTSTASGGRAIPKPSVCEGLRPPPRQARPAPQPPKAIRHNKPLRTEPRTVPLGRYDTSTKRKMPGWAVDCSAGPPGIPPSPSGVAPPTRARLTCWADSADPRARVSVQRTPQMCAGQGTRWGWDTRRAPSAPGVCGDCDHVDVSLTLAGVIPSRWAPEDVGATWSTRELRAPARRMARPTVPSGRIEFVVSSGSRRADSPVATEAPGT